MVQACMAGTSHDPRERHLQMFRKNASSEASPWRKKGRGGEDRGRRGEREERGDPPKG